MARPTNNFLREELEERQGFTYGDGFRLGFGAFIAFLLGSLIVGAISAAVVAGANALK